MRCILYYDSKNPRSEERGFFICAVRHNIVSSGGQHHFERSENIIVACGTNERDCPKGEMKLRLAANGRLILDKEKCCFEKPLFGRLFARFGKRNLQVTPDRRGFALF